jgi:hypothetical protein
MADIKVKKHKGYVETITTYKSIGGAHVGYKFESPLAMSRKLTQLIKKYNLDQHLQGRDVVCFAFFSSLEISLHIS